MRKVWSRIFLLCMACMICMSGLCLAKEDEEKENWVKFYTQDAYNIFYVDNNSIKIREYNGKKYLEVSLRRKEEYYEHIWVVVRKIEVTNAKFHGVYDLENQKRIFLTWENKYNKDKKGQNDISEIANGFDWTPWEKQLVSWVEQNRLGIINEIRTHNKSLPSAPEGKTDLTGAAHATGDMTPPQYDITDSGVVKYTMRADTHDSVKAWRSPGGPDYYIFKISESLRAKSRIMSYSEAQKEYVPIMPPGDYGIVYWEYPHEKYVSMNNGSWEFSQAYDPEEEELNKELKIYQTFSYDSATDMFTFYFGGSEEMRMRIIDRNTIYVEDSSGAEWLPKDRDWKVECTAVFNYVSYNSLTGSQKEYVDNQNILQYMDDGLWFPDHKCGMAGLTCWQNLFSACADAALAFKAVNGQIGELPEGYEITDWQK